MLKFIYSIPEDICSSMQLNYGTVVAQLESDNIVITLAVNGSVKVAYNPDPLGKPEDGDLYKDASQMPDELLQLFNRIDIGVLPNVNVMENNWLEAVTRIDGNEKCSYVYDDDLNPETVFQSLMASLHYWQTRTPEPGTVIHGTMRNIDLIPAFKSKLFELNKHECREYLKKNPNLLEALCDLEIGRESTWWETEEATIVSLELAEMLDAYSPQGYCFGAHPGDGSDFGYWKIENL